MYSGERGLYWGCFCRLFECLKVGVVVVIFDGVDFDGKCY